MPPHAVQESRSILVIVVVQLDLWIDHFPNHSLNRKCDCCSYHPPLIYCFLDLLRFHYVLSMLLIARGHLFTIMRWKFSGLIIGETDGRKMPQPPVGVLNICRADDMAVGGYLHLQAFPREVWWGQWSECSEIHNFPWTSGARTVRNPLLQASSSCCCSCNPPRLCSDGLAWCCAGGYSPSFCLWSSFIVTSLNLSNTL